MIIHPAGEGDTAFEFGFNGGGFRVERGCRQLTSHGGLAAFGKFVRSLGIIEEMERTCPIERTSPNATPVGDVMRGFLLACVSGANRFADIDMIRHDSAVAQAMGVEKRIPGEDAFPRMFAGADMEKCRAWMLAAQSWIWKAFEGRQFLILDWDSTVLTRYGDQDGAEIGYNPTKPGRTSHHPLLCEIAGARLLPMLHYRPGNSGSKTGWRDAMEAMTHNMPKDVGLYLNRGDIAFGCEDILSWHEEDSSHPQYLFRVKMSTGVRRVIDGCDDGGWEGKQSVGSLQVRESRIKLHGWTSERRVVLGRRLREVKAAGDGELFGCAVYEHYAWVTSLTCAQLSAWQVSELYFQRADCENVFDEVKNHWGFSGFCSQKAEVTEMAAWSTLLAYNLWTVFMRIMNKGSKDGHEEAKRGRAAFLRIPAQWCQNARQNILKLSLPDDAWERVCKGYANLTKLLFDIAPQLKSVLSLVVQLPVSQCLFIGEPAG
jgi:hypothetical protein